MPILGALIVFQVAYVYLYIYKLDLMAYPEWREKYGTLIEYVRWKRNGVWASIFPLFVILRQQALVLTVLYLSYYPTF